jgi:hypothetical protein
MEKIAIQVPGGVDVVTRNGVRLGHFCNPGALQRAMRMIHADR